MEKPPEVLACCLSIPRLMGVADDDVKAGPTCLTEVIAPMCEQRMQLLKFDAHGQARGLECARGECADVSFESLEVHRICRKNPVDERSRAAKQFGGCLRFHGYRR